MPADNDAVVEEAVIDLPVEDVVVKPVRKKRVKKVVADGDGAMVDRIRGGEWREVLREVGSVKYNELRLLALK